MGASPRSALLWLVAAAAFAPHALAIPETTVDLGYTKYVGQELSNGITQWLGMRYAAAPVGKLRFMPPEDPPHTGTTEQANKHGNICHSTGQLKKQANHGEDCLFVDVQAPTNATVDSKLPVFVYIHGGGFNINSNPNVNASGLIPAAEYDMVFVSFNYRVGPYGFISDGRNKIKANNGLRDQRKVFEWVQKNIAKFGGDPKHVVIGGSSAGAESVTIHLTADNGEDRGLFIGATAESPSFALMLTEKEAEYQYRSFATRFGCVGKDSLSCLQSKTEDELQAQNYNIPFPGGNKPPGYMWTPLIDGEFVPDYTYNLLEQGKFIKVPVIYGDDQNGGTKFVPQSTATQAEGNMYMLDQYPFFTLELLEEMNNLYPNTNTSCNSGDKGCFWRETSNAYGESRYMCPAMAVGTAISRYGVRNSYQYLWNVEDPDEIAQGLGVPHTVEFGAIIGPEFSPDSKVPKSYYKGGINEKASPVVQKYWTNFIRSLNPNRAGSNCKTDQTIWERWSANSTKRMVFQTGGKTEMLDIGDALRERCAFWQRNAVALHV